MDGEPIPLIIVDGFLGGSGAVLWGDFERYLNFECEDRPRRVIFVSVGPVSSLHDRACELYYALRGGPVDYGSHHSKIHGHLQYGRIHSNGLYPQWSSQCPLHFLGHSIGGPTILKLQYLLQAGYFGPNDDADMILSVTAVSSPFRGTQLVYSLGERADAAPAVQRFSIGSLLAKCVHVVTFFSPLLPSVCDLHAESRSLTFLDLSLAGLVRQMWSSDWAESRDATPFDVTFEAADERESRGEGYPYPCTFYQSYVASMPDSWITELRTTTMWSLLAAPLYLVSWIISSFDFTKLRPVPSFIDQIVTLQNHTLLKAEATAQSVSRRSEYQKNDGVVPVFSQWHPFSCSSTLCRHQVGEAVTGESASIGVWHVATFEQANHISIVPFWTGSQRQKAVWMKIGRYLRHADDRRSQIFTMHVGMASISGTSNDDV